MRNTRLVNSLTGVRVSEAWIDVFNKWKPALGSVTRSLILSQSTFMDCPISRDPVQRLQELELNREAFQLHLTGMKNHIQWVGAKSAPCIDPLDELPHDIWHTSPQVIRLVHMATMIEESLQLLKYRLLHGPERRPPKMSLRRSLLGARSNEAASKETLALETAKYTKDTGRRFRVKKLKYPPNFRQCQDSMVAALAKDALSFAQRAESGGTVSERLKYLSPLWVMLMPTPMANWQALYHVLCPQKRITKRSSLLLDHLKAATTNTPPNTVNDPK